MGHLLRYGDELMYLRGCSLATIFQTTKANVCAPHRCVLCDTFQTRELVGVLNGSSITSTCEVVVCPPALYLQGVAARIRPDIAVSAQVCVIVCCIILRV